VSLTPVCRASDPGFPRFTEAEIEAHTAPLKARIAELEAQATARKG
jgi:hypothetical protein